MKLRWQLGASRVLLRDSADLTRQWNCVSPFICYFSDTFTIDDMTASTAVTADIGLYIMPHLFMTLFVTEMYGSRKTIY